MRGKGGRKRGGGEGWIDVAVDPIKTDRFFLCICTTKLQSGEALNSTVEPL